jgi:hypothetical protein
MKKLILVAGATGNLGHRVVNALLERGAAIRAIVRTTSDKEKIAEMQNQGVEIVQVDSYTTEVLTEACKDISCVVSTLQGLHEVIVDAQKALLDAAIAAGVPHFIPSDFSVDFIPLPDGENRNFDLRREFHQYLAGKPIKTTSIFNGAFADILTYGNPLLNLKDKNVGYWHDENWMLDFTTMDNTAAFTAEVALDEDAPFALHIASFRTSPAQLAATLTNIMHTHFPTVRMGSLEELVAYNHRERAAHPEGENELYPTWQQGQYMQSMYTAQPPQLDNDRYPGIEWTNAETFLGKLRKHAPAT